jgi:hypothetical protein
VRQKLDELTHEEPPNLLSDHHLGATAQHHRASVFDRLGATAGALERIRQEIRERWRVCRPQIDLIVSDAKVLGQDPDASDPWLDLPQLPIGDLVQRDPKGCGKVCARFATHFAQFLNRLPQDTHGAPGATV